MLRAHSRRRFTPSLAESASRLEDRMVLSMAPAVVTPPITMPWSPAPGHDVVTPPITMPWSPYAGSGRVTPPITMPWSPAPGSGMSGPGAAEGGPVASPPIIWRGPYGG
jgi:hypothetical protein